MSVPVVPARHWTEYVPSVETVQRGLMILTVATSILIPIPGYRMTGAMGLRCVSLASAFLNMLNSPSEECWLVRIATCTKVASVALGMMGLVMAVPTLIITPVVLELFLQTFFIIGGAFQSDPVQLTFAISSLVANLIGCIALTTSSYGWMIAACWVNCVFMIISLINVCADCGSCALGRPARSQFDVIHAVGYGVLAVLSLVAFNQILGTTHYVNGRIVCNFTNQTNHPERIYTPEGKFLIELQPGETVHFKLSANHYRSHGDWTKALRMWCREHRGLGHNMRDHWDTAWKTPPLAPELYSTIPVTGSALTTRDLR